MEVKTVDEKQRELCETGYESPQRLDVILFEHRIMRMALESISKSQIEGVDDLQYRAYLAIERVPCR